MRRRVGERAAEETESSSVGGEGMDTWLPEAKGRMYPSGRCG